jgi:hypothetical protein
MIRRDFVLVLIERAGAQRYRFLFVTQTTHKVTSFFGGAV